MRDWIASCLAMTGTCHKVAYVELTSGKKKFFVTVHAWIKKKFVNLQP